jgi:predicted nucleotidyltransferase
MAAESESLPVHMYEVNVFNVYQKKLLNNLKEVRINYEKLRFNSVNLNVLVKFKALGEIFVLFFY